MLMVIIHNDFVLVKFIINAKLQAPNSK